MRVLLNGRAIASHAKDEGSIPFTRSKFQNPAILWIIDFLEAGFFISTPIIYSASVPERPNDPSWKIKATSLN